MGTDNYFFCQSSSSTHCLETWKFLFKIRDKLIRVQFTESVKSNENVDYQCRDQDQGGMLSY